MPPSALVVFFGEVITLSLVGDLCKNVDRREHRRHGVVLRIIAASPGKLQKPSGEKLATGGWAFVSSCLIVA